MTAAALIVTHSVASEATAKRNSLTAFVMWNSTLHSANYTDAMQMANLHRTCDSMHVTWCVLRAHDAPT